MGKSVDAELRVKQSVLFAVLVDQRIFIHVDDHVVHPLEIHRLVDEGLKSVLSQLFIENALINGVEQLEIGLLVELRIGNDLSEQL